MVFMEGALTIPEEFSGKTTTFGWGPRLDRNLPRSLRKVTHPNLEGLPQVRNLLFVG